MVQKVTHILTTEPKILFTCLIDKELPIWMEKTPIMGTLAAASQGVHATRTMMITLAESIQTCFSFQSKNTHTCHKSSVLEDSLSPGAFRDTLLNFT